jgi:hypothetical protein
VGERLHSLPSVLLALHDSTTARSFSPPLLRTPDTPSISKAPHTNTATSTDAHTNTRKTNTHQQVLDERIKLLLRLRLQTNTAVPRVPQHGDCHLKELVPAGHVCVGVSADDGGLEPERSVQAGEVEGAVGHHARRVALRHGQYVPRGVQERVDAALSERAGERAHSRAKQKAVVKWVQKHDVTE